MESLSFDGVRNGNTFVHHRQGSWAFWDTPFAKGEQGIMINGLIWMGDYEWMLQQIRHKLELGFRCVKLKIGAIDFEQELELLRFIRKHFPPEVVELRVDANVTFAPDQCSGKTATVGYLGLAFHRTTYSCRTAHADAYDYGRKSLAYSF